MKDGLGFGVTGMMESKNGFQDLLAVTLGC